MAFPLFTDGGLADGLWLSASGNVLPSKGSPGHEEAGTKPPKWSRGMESHHVQDEGHSHREGQTAQPGHRALVAAF